MGKIKRPSAADSFACRTRSGLLAITFLSVRFRARGERAYPPPTALFLSPLLSFHLSTKEDGCTRGFARTSQEKIVLPPKGYVPDTLGILCE